MLKIKNLTVLDDYRLLINFQDGENKTFDLFPYLDKGIFKDLKNKDYFKLVKNEGYFIKWPDDQDLSSDTLYIEGK